MPGPDISAGGAEALDTYLAALLAIKAERPDDEPHTTDAAARIA